MSIKSKSLGKNNLKGAASTEATFHHPDHDPKPAQFCDVVYYCPDGKRSNAVRVYFREWSEDGKTGTIEHSEAADGGVFNNGKDRMEVPTEHIYLSSQLHLLQGGPERRSWGC